MPVMSSWWITALPGASFAGGVFVQPALGPEGRPVIPPPPRFPPAAPEAPALPADAPPAPAVVFVEPPVVLVPPTLLPAAADTPPAPALDVPALAPALPVGGAPAAPVTGSASLLQPARIAHHRPNGARPTLRVKRASRRPESAPALSRASCVGEHWPNAGRRLL